jgi:glycosyltransferase involved in cell wall biosynthesis
VAVVDEELPYPLTSGKRIRTLNLLLRLAERHRLTYLCHRNLEPAETRQAAEYLNDHGIRTVVVDRSVPRKSGPLFYARLAANLLSPLPYSVASHRSRALQRALADHAVRERVDLWQCEWTPYMANLACLNGVRRLMIAHNVESLIWQRYHKTETSSLKRWYIGQQWRKFHRFEQKACAAADCTVAVSVEDARRLGADFGARRVAVVDNGVDTSYFQPGRGPRQPGNILFLGSLDWRPNLDAVAQLLDRVHPTVRAAEAGATLCLVGRNPPEWLCQKVRGMPGVELHGNVADVRPYLARAEVLAVPLRIGGGSRLKILEALASEVPVVSTQIGAEGLSLEPGRHLTVVPGIEDMAGAILACLRAPEAAASHAACGRCRVLECYDWSTLADKLEQVWLTLACSASEGPSSLALRARP